MKVMNGVYLLTCTVDSTPTSNSILAEMVSIVIMLISSRPLIISILETINKVPSDIKVENTYYMRN